MANKPKTVVRGTMRVIGTRCCTKSFRWAEDQLPPYCPLCSTDISDSVSKWVMSKPIWILSGSGPASKDDRVTIEGVIDELGETEKAYKFSDNNRMADGKLKYVYFAKSHSTWDDENNTITVPIWAAKEKGLL